MKEQITKELEYASVPCACNYACKGSWALPQYQFCRWNNPGKAVDWDMRERERLENPSAHVAAGVTGHD